MAPLKIDVPRALMLMLTAAFVCGCAAPNVPDFNSSADTNGSDVMRPVFEKVSFRTEDDFKISGNLLRGENKAVILLHQLGRDKSSYDSFAKKLNDSNFTVLALDLRGHGESLERDGLRYSYSKFSDKNFQDMELDVAAAKKFLLQHGFKTFAIVGSSIGANTALNFASHDHAIEKIILLSPGLNYKGIETEKNAKNVLAKTLFVATPGDDYSYASSKALLGEIAGAEFKELQGFVHGTDMFLGTTLERELTEWLQK